MSRILFLLLLVFVFSLQLPAQNLQQIGHLPYAPLHLAGCWHHVDNSGKEWGLIGTSAGLSLVDLQDPAQPIERFNVPGLANNWREVRTWAGYAYVCSEAIPSGITIINLNYLPDSIQWKVWRGDGFFVDKVKESHTLQAVDGFLYLFGGGEISDGAIIASLSDPWNPHILSKYAAHYVHDGFVRGDTLWTSEGNASQFGVVDISNRSNPVLLLTNPIPGGYSHNCELSADSKTLFATAETQGAPLSSFDVSNLEDIRLLDGYHPSKKPQGEVHNVRVMPGDFLVCPSYSGQLTLVDASQPDNMIEIAWDSLGKSPIWDADPYLPSGIILATAKNEGLFIYQATYSHAARIQGLVTDAATGFPLADAKVFVLNTPNADTTGAVGFYKTGAATSGNYVLRAERVGYQPQVVTNVPLVSGGVSTRNFALSPLPVETKALEKESFVSVSPSPFEDELRVEVSDKSLFNSAEIVLRLSDYAGKTILETRADASGVTILDGLKSLPAGAYWLQVFNKKEPIYGVKLLKI